MKQPDGSHIYMFKKKEIVHLDPNTLKISPKQVARYAGGPGYTPGPSMISLAETMLKKAKNLVKPVYGYAAIPVLNMIGQDSLILQNGTVVKLVEPWESKPLFIMALIYTIGSALDNELETLNKKEANLDALFLNASGLAVLDVVFQRAYTKIQEDTKRSGFYAGCCHEPGCESTSLSDQQWLFDCVDVQSLGVSINTSYVLTPFKTIACWIPLADHPLKIVNKNKCLDCSLSTCMYKQKSSKKLVIDATRP